MKINLKVNRAFLLRWHWRIGLSAAFFLFVIALTGLALNHARALGLHHIYLDAEWILTAYNMDLPPDIPPEMAEEYRGKGITLEKFMLDLHTGAIIGLPGKLLSDLTALAILILSASGVYNWWKRKKR